MDGADLGEGVQRHLPAVLPLSPQVSPQSEALAAVCLNLRPGYSLGSMYLPHYCYPELEIPENNDYKRFTLAQASLLS